MCKISCLGSVGSEKSRFWSLRFEIRNYPLSQNYVTSEGAVFHNVLYNQQLFIAHYQLSFYANNYFDQNQTSCPVPFETRSALWCRAKIIQERNVSEESTGVFKCNQSSRQTTPTNGSSGTDINPPSPPPQHFSFSWQSCQVRHS